MRKLAPVLYVILLVALTLTLLMLGSCALPARATAAATAIQEASASISLLGSDGGKDATNFLVGEFTESNGTLARFNGFGDVTIIRSDGESSTGSYDMIDYGGKQAVVTININGTVSAYSFDLLSGSGDFTLTDGSGRIYGFTPVVY